MLIECKYCEALVDAKVLHEKAIADEDSLGYLYSFVQCPSCSAPMLTVQEASWTAIRNGAESGWDKPVRVYLEGTRGPDASLPDTVRNAYSEAISCFKARSYLATSIMCRKALEAMCKEHGTGRRNLARALDHLRDQGIIEQRLFQWAEALRIAGNEAAHEIDAQIPRDDAKDILDFTEALLQYVFTFRDRFDQFMKRRDTGAKSA